MPKKPFGFALLILLLAIGVFLAVAIIVFRSSGQAERPLIIRKLADEIAPKPSPFLFEELTIPYLRNREYKSNLGELVKYSENGSFTSYLTNYDSDGLKINGLLTIPKSPPSLTASEGQDTGRYPAIVFVHGYIAPTIYKTTERYNDYVNYLAAQGFVVFKIDLRGHGDSEGEPGGAYYSSDYVIDTLNAYSALQNADFVKPDAIGLWGHSMAGNVTFKSFVVNGRIPALVIWAGAGYTYSDLREYMINDNSYRPPEANTERQRKRQLLRDTYGEFDPDSSFWKQVVATNYLDGVEGAIELHHAVDDNVVSIEYSRNLMNVLDGSKIPHELFEYSSGGHNLTGNSFSLAMSRTVEFYKNELTK